MISENLGAADHGRYATGMAGETQLIEAAAGFGNMVLYRMCAERPKHDDAHINGQKALLIGRTYSASPSRGLGELVEPNRDDFKPTFFDRLGEKLAHRARELDERIARAKTLPFSRENLTALVAVHKYFDELVTEFCSSWAERAGKTRKVHGRSSFASKYLHFHAPDAFPIMDSLVKGYVRDALRDGGRLRGNGLLPRHLDICRTDYAKYCWRLLVLIDRRGWSDRSLREIDARMLGYWKSKLETGR